MLQLNKFMLFLIVLLVANGVSATSYAVDADLNLPLRFQEQNQWCWAGSGQSIMEYYRTTVAQCDIADWARINNAWGTDKCCANPSGAICNQPNYIWGSGGSLQTILQHWGVNSTAVGSHLVQGTAVSEINAGRPFLMRFGWKNAYGQLNGFGHFLVGYGYQQDGSILEYLDPWPGHGFRQATYGSVIDDTDHTWTHSLQITSNMTRIFVSPTSVNYGNLKAGTTSSAQILTVLNVGPEDLLISTISLTGASSSQFGKIYDSCSGQSISPSGNCAIWVVFSPTSVGLKNANVTIPSDDPNSPSISVPLSGTGIVTLSIIKPGTGTGTVTSTPSGISCGADCTEDYSVATNVTLIATPSPSSIFEGWSGSCSGTGNCVISMSGNSTVFATFTNPSNPPVRISGTSPQYFNDLQSAYNAAVNGDVIQSLGVDISGNLNANRNITVTLQGGYDSSYQNWIRDTNLIGALTTSAGSISVGNFTIRN